MKRFAIAAASALTLVGPLAATTAYADPPGHQNNWDNNRGNDRNDRRDNGRNHRADNNRGQRWNQNQHNGYYMNGRFNYGPPPAYVQDRRDFRPAWQDWRRGDRLPSYYRSQYRTVDYRSARLRAPPRGYQYVRDDRGEFLLVAITTGIILSILANQ